MNNKNLIRQCISCRKQLPRENFIRIVKTNAPSSVKIVLSPSKYQLGRSVYICRNVSCISLTLKAKKIEKMLKVKEIYLEEIINGLKGFSASLAEEVTA